MTIYAEIKHDGTLATPADIQAVNDLIEKHPMFHPLRKNGVEGKVGIGCFAVIVRKIKPSDPHEYAMMVRDALKSAAGDV